VALLGTAIALPLSATLSTGAHVAGLHGVALVERPGARSAADDPERSRLAGRSDPHVAVPVPLARAEGLGGFGGDLAPGGEGLAFPGLGSYKTSIDKSVVRK
jgi:hypothetical protein